MGTVPTDRMERELRKYYVQWLAGVPRNQDKLADYIKVFEKHSTDLIAKLGGQAASLGALADFPVPKLLELSPRAGVIYNEMQQAAIRASIAAGLQSTEAARAIFNAGIGQSFNKLNRLARTETVSAYWKNQWDSTADLPLIVMLWGSEQSKRTCDYCLSRDGLVVEDGQIRDHPNGRCTLIPTLRSSVKYKGTLQADGRVTMDPAWTQQRVAGAKAQTSAGPTTATQRDPLSGKSNPAAPSKALTAPQPASVSAVSKQDQYLALDRYASNSFKLNSELRAGIVTNNDVLALDELLSKPLARQLDVRRVISGDAAQEALLAARTGNTYKDAAYMSTQKASHGALEDMIDDYSNLGGDTVVFDIKLPKGSTGLDVGDALKNEQGFYDEGEVILPRNMEFTTSKPTQVDGVWHVKMTPVSSDVAPISAPTPSKPPVSTGSRPFKTLKSAQLQAEYKRLSAIRKLTLPQSTRLAGIKRELEARGLL